MHLSRGRDSDMTTESRPAGRLLAGGRYVLLKQICRTSGSAIFRAKDTETEELVAVKKPLEHRLEDPFIRRIFSLESDILEAVGHRAVVSLLERSEDPLFLVMEHLDGRMLHECGNPSIEDILTLSLRMCDVLKDIHGMGIIHRDIKPENILLLPGKEPQLKLLDFGCALAPSIVSEDPYQDKEYMGTMDYTPPEHTLFQRGASDCRSDVYSLGMLMYELAVRSLPFDSRMPKSDPDKYEYHKELMRLQCYEMPEPPHMLDRSIPPHVSNLILRAISKRPEDRFQSAFGMSESIAASLIELHVKQFSERS